MDSDRVKRAKNRRSPSRRQNDRNCPGMWSIGKASDGQVSDEYVTFGTRFNVTVAAFVSLGIDLS